MPKRMEGGGGRADRHHFERIMNVTSALGWILGSSSAGGAIDVVAVRHDDGSFTCSPFHVKMPVRSRAKEAASRTVSLHVNGAPVKNVSMRLGSAGEACFIIKNIQEDTLRGGYNGVVANPGPNVQPTSHPLSTIKSDCASRDDDDSHRNSSTVESDKLIAGTSASFEFRRSLSSNHLPVRGEGVRRAQLLREGVPRTLTPDIRSESTGRRRFYSCERAGEVVSDVHEKDDEKSTENTTFPLLTEKNLAQVQQRDKVSLRGEEMEERRNTATSWKWTWGDLPIQLSDPSLADLHSHSLSISNGNNLSSSSASPLCVDKTSSSTSTSTVLLRSRRRSHKGDSSRQKAEGADDVSLHKQSQSAQKDSTIERRELHEGGESGSGCQTEYDFSKMNEGFVTKEEATPFRRQLSLCAHVLCGEEGSPEEVPKSSEALQQLLAKYAVTEEQFAVDPVRIVTNPNLVVVVNDLLIPWRLAHAHLTSIIASEGDDDSRSCASNGVCGNEGAYSSISKHDRALLWAGKNVSTWKVDTTASDGPLLRNQKSCHSYPGATVASALDEDDYGQIDIDSLSDRSSTIDNGTTNSRNGEMFFVDESGELLSGMYGNYFNSSSCEEAARVNMWSKQSVDWNSCTDLAKMRFQLFQSFTLGSGGCEDQVPDLLRPYVDASKEKDLQSLRSTNSVSEVEEDTGPPGPQTLALQASRSHESALDVLLSPDKQGSTGTTQSYNHLPSSQPTAEMSALKLGVDLDSSIHAVSASITSASTNNESGVRMRDPLEGEKQPQKIVDPPREALEEEVQRGCLLLENISPDDILPGPARGDVTSNDESDTESFYSLNFDDLESCTSTAPEGYVSEGDFTASADGDSKCAETKRYKDAHKYPYRKSLVPSQDQIMSLNLENGQNEITFQVEGEEPVQAHVYVWPPDAKVVVVDIEGAVFASKGEKSLGKLAMSLWGGSGAQKETHEGLAQLFSNISKNGYHFLYLATTPNASSKEDLLKARQAGAGAGLPLGPVFLPPDALIRSLGRERTDLYKAAALRGVRTLFPGLQHNPYHAAFGAHVKDVRAFDRCGLPLGRTFLVNEVGEVTTVRITTGKRSFSDMNSMLNEIFPTISDAFCHEGPTTARSSSAAEDAYGDFNFWRVPPTLLQS